MVFLDVVDVIGSDEFNPKLRGKFWHSFKNQSLLVEAVILNLQIKIVSENFPERHRRLACFLIISGHEVRRYNAGRTSRKRD